MPRRNRSLRPEPKPSGGRVGATRTELYRGESYEVRTVSGEAGKTYRCPGCDQLVTGGRPHVVAWAAHTDGDDRRHWHTPCWANRDRRSVTRRWS